MQSACEPRIPRSGTKGAAVNCFTVAIDRNDEPYFLASEFVDGELIGLVWNADSYSEPVKIPIDSPDTAAIRITHYYGLATVSFDSIFDFAWHNATKQVYLFIRLRDRLERSFQYLFNKKRLIAKRRMDLLRFIVNDQMDRAHNGIRKIELLTKIYSMRLFLHPEMETQSRSIKLYLDSLVESEDLRENNGEYTATGKAIATLESFEEIEQRHVATVKLQQRTMWIALLALLFAVVETEIVKVPTLLELGSSSEGD